MYKSIISVNHANVEHVINSYSEDAVVDVCNDCYVIKLKYLESCIDVHSIFKNEELAKISSLIVPIRFEIDKSCFDYVKQNNDKILFVEDYIWHCITHSIPSSIINEVEKSLLSLEYDELYLLFKYIESGGNASSTAKAMYIHRNTMDYKLNKWSKYFSLNIKKTKTLMILSFLIYKFDLIK